MADPVPDLSTQDAKTKAAEAIRAGAASVVVERQQDGKWTLKVT